MRFAWALVFFLAACSDEMEESYASLAEAERAGALERGWIPTFVPASARDIKDSHNLDTNRQTLQFTVHPSDIQSMVAGLQRISASDKTAARELSGKRDLEVASEAYVVCARPQNGVLLVDRKSGRAVYDTTIQWTDDDC